MASFSRNDVVLVPFPFSDQSNSKVRPVVVVSAQHPSRDHFVVPLTSKVTDLLPGEFLLSDSRAAGLRLPSAVKRGLTTVQASIVIRKLGRLAPADARQLDDSLRAWLGL